MPKYSTHCGQFLDIFITDSERCEPYILRELGELRIRKHRDVPDQFVDAVWLRRVIGVGRVTHVLGALIADRQTDRQADTQAGR